jgi:peptidoglycan/xylan/chitin deacetylase (PgdA/CDA1 family)
VNVWDGQGADALPLMDWETIRALRQRDFTFGGHTATHPALTALDNSDVVRELARCRATLTREVGESRHLAYPYGLADRGIASLAGMVGFETAVMAGGGAAGLAENPMMLPRVEVHADMPFDEFVRALGMQDAARAVGG